MAKQKKGKKKQARPEGQLRQSQLITTFGPGSMVDLVDRAVVIGGLEHWGYGKDGAGEPLDDARLRRSLIPRLKALHPDLDLARENYFRKPPEGDMRDPWPNIGVRALEFPRWFVCQGCKRLARAADGFENKGGRYRHQCGRNRSSHAVPVRFVAACRRGHLSDFPWVGFAHLDDKSGCQRWELYLHEGATGDFGKIVVECRNCNSRQPMNRAMASFPFDCYGDRPWLGGRAANEPDCDEKLRLLVRTGSDAYFSQVVSALRLPDADEDPLQRRIRDKKLWDVLKDAGDASAIETLLGIIGFLREGLDGYSAKEIAEAVQRERDAESGGAARPLRSAEFDRITSAELEQPGQVPPANAQFAAYRVPDARIDLPKGVESLIVVPELREVRVQVSFSRFDSISANLQGEFDYERLRVRPAPLTMPGGNQKWLPAAEVRGEGIFVKLDEKAVQAWESSDLVSERIDKLRIAFEADSRGAGFPGGRFYMLHSLAHLLMTAISLECGYAASALKERIYCEPPGTDEAPMAAILISTGTTGSEGTLGGLVEEGRRLRHHLREAWDMGRLCSNDPVCAAHDPSSDSSDRRTEGAACHGCLYIAECSCERFNRFLDRALVIPTIGNEAELAFFKERP